MFKANSSTFIVMFIDQKALCADGEIGNAGKYGGKLEFKR